MAGSLEISSFVFATLILVVDIQKKETRHKNVSSSVPCHSNANEPVTETTITFCRAIRVLVAKSGKGN